jgi:Skp family chaperone for outer membrane proteins
MFKNALLGISFVCGVAALVIVLSSKEPKPVYIEMGKVYEEFQLAKELTKELETILKSKKTYIDSLYENLRRGTQELKFKEKKNIEDIKSLAKLEEEFYYKKQQFEKENQAMSTDVNTKVWNQLNQYIKDYGELKKLTILFGANGQGNIMYGNAKYDVTKEVVEYVNGRYNDIIKK